MGNSPFWNALLTIIEYRSESVQIVVSSSMIRDMVLSLIKSQDKSHGNINVDTLDELIRKASLECVDNTLRNGTAESVKDTYSNRTAESVKDTYSNSTAERVNDTYSESGLEASALKRFYLNEMLSTMPLTQRPIKTPMHDAGSAYNGYGSIYDNSGCMEHLLDFIQESQRYLTSKKQMTDLFKEEPDLGKNARVIAERFQNDPRVQALDDSLCLYQKEYRAGYKHVKDYIKGKTLFFIGFWYLPPYQKRLVEALLDTADIASFLVYYDKEKAFYKAAETLYSWLVELPLTVREIPFLGAGAGIMANKWLYKADSFLDEVIFTAKTIHRLINEQGKSYADILITVPSLTEYGRYIEDIFPGYGIPFTIHQRKPVSDTAAAVFLDQLLELSENFTQDALLHFIRLPFAQDIADPGGKETRYFNNDWLTSFVYEYSGLNTPSEWIEALDQKYGQLLENSDNEDLADYCKPQLEVLKKQKKALEFLFSIIDTIQNAPSEKSLVTAIQAAFSCFRINEKIQQLHTILSDMDDNTADICRSYYSESCEAFTVIGQIMKDFQGFASHPNSNQLQEYPLFNLNIPTQGSTIPAKQMIKNLRFFLNQARLPMQKTLDSVHITGKFEAFMTGKPVVFILGLIEKQWPGMVKENMFCSNSKKHKLGWPDRETYYLWDLYLIHALIEHAYEGAFLSYPLNQGHTPSTASHFLLLLKTAYDLPEIVFKNDKSDVQSYAETLINLGFQTKSKPSLSTPDLALKKSPHLQELWQKNMPRSLSVSQLETYQLCPYHYFFKYVLIEYAPAAQSHDIPPLIWGSFMHHLMRVLCDKYKAVYGSLPPSKLANVLLETAREHFIHYSKDSFYWQIKYWQLFGAGSDSAWDKNASGSGLSFMQRIVNDLLTLFQDFTLISNEFEFKALEVGENEQKLNMPSDNEKVPCMLTGKIDIILNLRNHSGITAVWDFKTGKKLPGPSDLKTMRSLQLPIYSLALKKIRPPGLRVFGGYYHLVDSAEFGQHVVLIDPEIKDYVNIGLQRPFKADSNYYFRLEDLISKLSKRLKDGYFSTETIPELEHMAKTRAVYCKQCPYRHVCLPNCSEKLSERSVYASV
ncbi:PD-(D/E)XK nuclease family protein [Thermoproteota archaeon]